MRQAMLSVPDFVNPALGNNFIRAKPGLVHRFLWSGFYQKQARCLGRHFRILPIKYDASRWRAASIIQCLCSRKSHRNNMPSGHPFSTRRVNPFSLTLIKSYCKGCGLLIAASLRRRILVVMEKLHECPVYFHYEQPLRRAS
jgi:hypothetical protein